MTEACGVQECPYCRHSRKLGSSARLSVALSTSQCVSIFMTNRTVGKMSLQTASIVCQLFIWRAVSDGENRRWDKFNPMHELLLISLNPARPSQSRWGPAESRTPYPIERQSLLCLPAEAFVSRSQASLSLSSLWEPLWTLTIINTELEALAATSKSWP